MHTIGEIPLFLLNPIQSFLATQKIYTAFCLLTQKISKAYTLKPGFLLRVPCIHVYPMAPNRSQPLPIEEGRRSDLRAIGPEAPSLETARMDCEMSTHPQSILVEEKWVCYQ